MAHVLVVDDDDDIALIVSMRLRAEGHEVDIASDGIAALEAVRAGRHDVVVLDWMMPGLNGIEVCEHLRADPDVAGTRVLLLSARSLPADRERATRAGVDAYLAKPFDVHDLVEHVRALAIP